MSHLTIISKGLLTTIQDRGRYGHRSEGIPLSGAMDQASAQLANILVDNHQDDAVIECTMMGPKIQFHVTTYIAITGATVDIYLDDTLQSMNTTLQVSPDSILKFGRIHKGCRFYIAIASGINTPNILGSKSYDSVSKIGLAPLKKGDQLSINDPSAVSQLIYINPTLGSSVIKVYPGPEFELIKKADLTHLNFTVLPTSNRMAYNLESQVSVEHNFEMISSAVLPGTIQLTPAGRWIALMRDAQTTGGYPRVLQIEKTDINKLAQLRGGDTFKIQII